jgi:hypothetical protein
VGHWRGEGGFLSMIPALHATSERNVADLEPESPGAASFLVLEPKPQIIYKFVLNFEH